MFSIILHRCTVFPFGRTELTVDSFIIICVRDFLCWVLRTYQQEWSHFEHSRSEKKRAEATTTQLEKILNFHTRIAQAWNSPMESEEEPHFFGFLRQFFFFVVFWSIVCAAHRQRFGINRAPAAWCLKLLYRMQFEVLSGWLTCLVMQIEDGVVASDRAQNFKTFFYNFFVICRFPQSLHFSRCRLECLNSIGGIARPEPERNVFEAQKN